MAARFLTEKKIEDLLTEEVRSLPYPDGSPISIRAFKLTWANYDIVVQHGPLSAAEISLLMLFYARKTGYSLPHALREILVPLRKQANEIIDNKLALIRRKTELRENLRKQFRAAAMGVIKPGEARLPTCSGVPVVFNRQLRHFGGKDHSS